MKKLKFNWNESLLIVSIFLIEFATYTKNVISVTDYSQILINISIVLLFIGAFLTLITIKAKAKIWLICFITLAIAIFSSIKTNDSLLLQLSLIIICSFKINFKNIVKKDLIVKTIILLFILFCYHTGNVEMPYFTRDGQIRYSFGFNQPNALGFFLLSSFFEYIYLKNEKIKMPSFIIFTCIILYFLNLAGSRSAEIVILLFSVIFCFQRIMKNKKYEKFTHKKDYSVLTVVLFVLFSILSFYITYKYSQGAQFAIEIDEILSERIYLQNLFVSKYNITLLGNDIFYFDTLDNVYIRIFINYGFLVWALYIYIYFMTMRKAKIEYNKIVENIIFCFLIYGLMEWYIVRPAMNIFLIYFSCNANKKKEVGDISEE